MSQPPAKIPFQKPWVSYPDLVSLLQQRGLVVADEPVAEQFLSHLSYYRFSGYCLAFEVRRHEFIAGATFEQVVASYQFDLTLRDLVTEALEVVEVDLRAGIAHLFGEKHGPFGHADPAQFHRHFRHDEWLGRLRDEAGRSSELFVTHFKQTYSEFPDLPVWCMTEVMSFGGLSTMFAGMLRNDQRMIAQRYRLQPHILASWMHHLVYVRNLCAHHARLWDRVWTIKPELPAGKGWQPPHLLGNNRLFSALLILRHLMKHMPAVQAFASEWQTRVVTHLASPPTSPNPFGLMGLTANWNQHPVWL
jgi:abortive infection bacteriophage resistance protein